MGAASHSAITSVAYIGTPAQPQPHAMGAADSDPAGSGILVKAAKPVCAVAVSVAEVVSNTTQDLKFEELSGTASLLAVPIFTEE